MLDRASPQGSPAGLRQTQPLPDALRGFLIESNRRVVAHCETLLAAGDLADDQRHRLAVVLASATDQLQQAGGL
jgi:hypothetical protein